MNGTVGGAQRETVTSGAIGNRPHITINNINNNPIFHGEDPSTSDSGRRALP